MNEIMQDRVLVLGFLAAIALVVIIVRVFKAKGVVALLTIALGYLTYHSYEMVGHIDEAAGIFGGLTLLGALIVFFAAKRGTPDPEPAAPARKGRKAKAHA